MNSTAIGDIGAEPLRTVEVEESVPWTRIDLNSDIGEVDDGGILDAQLLDVITSANVACGGHAGDAASMHRVCGEAIARGVVIGAQVSYDDREGFGRRRLDVAPARLRDDLRRQYEDLHRAAAREGGRVAYLKPHGALYHAALDEPATADVLVELARDYGIAVLTMHPGALHRHALAADVPVFREAFVDRGYQRDGRLTPRGESGDLLAEDAALARLRTWVDRSFADAHSLCVHSDTPGAASLAWAARQVLAAAGVAIAPFTPLAPIDPDIR